MNLFHASLIQATDDDGNPVSGAKWHFYLTETTTETPVYTAEGASLGFTVTANAAGWFVPIYLDSDVSYRAVLRTPAGATIGGHDVDPVNPDVDLVGATVTPEQFGAIGDNVANDLPAWRAMYTYAKANGIKACRCAPNAIYAWWAQTLTGADTYDAFDVNETANFLTISHDFFIDGQGARINCKAYTGGSLQSVTQAITAYAVWRGSGISVIGGTTGTNSFGIAKVGARNLTVNGGWTRVVTGSYAGDIAESGVASEHKGFRIQDTYIGRLDFENVEFSGWGAECWYFGNKTDMPITLINCRGGNSNQSAFNPNRGGLIDTGGKYGNAPIAIESVGGSGQSYNGTYFYDSYINTIFGAGMYGGVLNGYYAIPSNTGSEAVLPWVTFDDVTFDDCRSLACPNYMRGSLTLVDTNLSLSSYPAAGCKNIDLEVHHIIHKQTVDQSVFLQGPTGLAETTFGVAILPPQNVRVGLTVSRTDYAVANSKILNAGAVRQQGYIKQASCTIDVSTVAAGLKLGDILSTNRAMARVIAPEISPTFSVNGSTSWSAGALSLSPESPAVPLTFTGGAATVDVNFSNPMDTGNGYNYADGQSLRCIYHGSTTAGTVMNFPASGGGWRMPRAIQLRSNYDYIDFIFHDNLNTFLYVGHFTKDEVLGTATQVLTGTDATTPITSDALAALWEKAGDVASATTTTFGEGGYFNVTGTTTITDIDFTVDKSGRKIWVKFTGALTLTHNATTLILPTGANIVTAAGDMACFVSENGTDNITCLSYTYVARAANTGWTTGTGTPNKGAYAAYAGQNVSPAYVEAEAQATDDAAKLACQRVLALEDALRAQGIIN